MNGNRILIDTNTAIYLLNGDFTLAAILDQKNINISFITQLELLGFKGVTEQSEKMINDLIENCVVIDINNSIKNEVINQPL
ncbi:MAG: hypothetical protein ACERKD_15650 [Prolixibacteraceae bacterium]